MVKLRFLLIWDSLAIMLILKLQPCKTLISQKYHQETSCSQSYWWLMGEPPIYCLLTHLGKLFLLLLCLELFPSPTCLPSINGRMRGEERNYFKFFLFNSIFQRGGEQNSSWLNFDSPLILLRFSVSLPSFFFILIHPYVITIFSPVSQLQLK